MASKFSFFFFLENKWINGDFTMETVTGITFSFFFAWVSSCFDIDKWRSDDDDNYTIGIIIMAPNVNMRRTTNVIYFFYINKLHLNFSCCCFVIATERKQSHKYWRASWESMESTTFTDLFFSLSLFYSL